MGNNKKIEAFTLGEMVVVLILTSIVVGLAFSVLALVQNHLRTIQGNFSNNTELNRLEQVLWLDFNRYPHITFNDRKNSLRCASPLDSVSYGFYENYIVREQDTFPVSVKTKTLFFNGETIINGKTDALKVEMALTFQEQTLFIYKQNDATAYMD